MLPTISILMVTYNSRGHLPACLNSISAETRVPYEIIIVDNASHDDTVEQVRTNYPQIRLIENKQNVGFAVAVNQAARVSTGRYLLLLNPDTVVQQDAIDRLTAFLEANPVVGICAPRILSTAGRIRHNCFAFETPWSFFWFGVGVGPLHRVRDWMLRRNDWDIAADTPQKVEAVTGAVLLVRRELFERLGGLDERFFMYCEDGDFCLRARKAGSTAMLVPNAVVSHSGGASTPESSVRLNGMIGQHLLNSRYRYIQKYWGSGAMLALRLSYVLAGVIFIIAGGLSFRHSIRHQLVQHGGLLLMTPTRSSLLPHYPR